MKRAGRVNDCATFLDFTYSDDDMCRLAHANFCKDTLCPQCAKRKSMKVYTQVKSCVDYLQKNEDKAFLFATLTVKNCSGDDLLFFLFLFIKSRIVSIVSRQIRQPPLLD